MLPADINVRTRLAGGYSTPGLNHPAHQRRHGYRHRKLHGHRHGPGRLGVIHKNMPIRQQADQVDRVKRSETASSIIPFSLPGASRQRCRPADGQVPSAAFPSAMPTASWWASSPTATSSSCPASMSLIGEVMTKEHLITAPPGHHPWRKPKPPAAQQGGKAAHRG